MQERLRVEEESISGERKSKDKVQTSDDERKRQARKDDEELKRRARKEKEKAEDKKLRARKDEERRAERKQREERESRKSSLDMIDVYGDELDIKQDAVLSIMNGSAGQVVETMISLCGGSSGAALPATMILLL